LINEIKTAAFSKCLVAIDTTIGVASKESIPRCMLKDLVKLPE